MPRWLTGLTDQIGMQLGRPATRAGYIPQLDGLRFIAILIVVLWHISLRASRQVDARNAAGARIHSLYAWFPHGEMGVALFFFISGFIIARPFLDRAPSQWRVGQFYLRRARRIYPPYAVMLTLCLALLAVGGADENRDGISLLGSWLASLGYAHGLIHNYPSVLDPPLWSLEVEAQFYLVAPLLLLAYRYVTHSGTRAALGVVAVLALLALASLMQLGQFDGRCRFGLVTHLYLFVAGIVTADLTRRHDPLSRPASGSHDLLLAAGLLGLVGVGLYLTQVDARPRAGWPALLCNLAALAAVLAIHCGAMGGRIGRIVLGARWITAIGAMCFSIYLVHVVVIEATARLLLRHLPLGGAATIWGVHLLILLPLTALASVVFFIAIERPFMSTRKLPSRLAVGWMRARPAPDGSGQ